MQRDQYPRREGDVLDPTEASQASPRKMNFRVLLTSMALAAAVGFVLVYGFWSATPTSMDYSSGGKLSETQPAPGAAPEPAQPGPAPAAPDASPSPTPPQAPASP